MRVEAPGVAPADLDISLNDGVLTISGEKQEIEREEGETQHYSERRYGAFRRSLKIEAPIDLENVKATHTHGVVTIEPAPRSRRPSPSAFRSKSPDPPYADLSDAPPPMTFIGGGACVGEELTARSRGPRFRGQGTG